MHTDRARLYTGAGIGNSQRFQESLNRSIFPARSMQREKRQVDLLITQVLRERRSYIDGHRIVPTTNQRSMDRSACPERYLALSRLSSHQYPDAGRGQKRSLCRMRLVHTATFL